LTSDVRVIDVPGVPRFEIAPHNCFACGSLNTHGMHLVHHIEQRRSWVETTVEERFQGWDGIAHGGIVCTLLDEVMAWSLAAEDLWGVTARMAVRFHRPLEVGRPIRADGWIERTRRRLIDTRGVLVDVSSGVQLASAEGTYAAVDEARKGELRKRYILRPPSTAAGLDESHG
jgi:acyl-coenzyme A thioesterase PaaI-like protein